MSRQLWRSAIVIGMSTAIMASAGYAQTRYYPQGSAVRPTPYQDQSRHPNAAPATLVGTYKSDAFFPLPLVLTIGGADRYGNLSGSISGMRSSFHSGETSETWENWQRVFGRDGTRASYRDGTVTIVFPNGATYSLDNRGSELAGKFTAGTENRPISFRKSFGIAQR